MDNLKVFWKLTPCRLLPDIYVSPVPYSFIFQVGRPQTLYRAFTVGTSTDVIYLLKVVPFFLVATDFI